MGVMRKNLLLVLALFTLVCVRANADITPAQISKAKVITRVITTFVINRYIQIAIAVNPLVAIISTLITT